MSRRSPELVPGRGGLAGKVSLGTGRLEPAWWTARGDRPVRVQSSGGGKPRRGVTVAFSGGGGAGLLCQILGVFTLLYRKLRETKVKSKEIRSYEIIIS